MRQLLPMKTISFDCSSTTKVNAVRKNNQNQYCFYCVLLRIARRGV